MLLAAITSLLHLAHSNGRLQPALLRPRLHAEQLGNEFEVTQLQVAGNKNSDVLK
jgi:hypothetical protein